MRLQEVGLRAEEMVGEGLGASLHAPAKAVLAKQQLPAAAQEGSLMCSRAFEPHKGTDVACGEYAGGKQQHQMVLDEKDVWSL